jgi:hypothetical protein
MPETAAYGFEYETPQSKPGITLTGDIGGTSPILAEQVETVISGIDSRLAAAEGDIVALQASAASDTGWLTLSTSPGAGFSLTSALYRRWGAIVMIRVEYERTGADIVATSTGNVIGDPTIATINVVDARPSQPIQALVHSSVTSGAGTITTSGVINLTDMNTNSTIAASHLVRVTSMYFGPSFI